MKELSKLMNAQVTITRKTLRDGSERVFVNLYANGHRLGVRVPSILDGIPKAEEVCEALGLDSYIVDGKTVRIR